MSIETTHNTSATTPNTSTDPQGLEIRGLSNGLGLFHVDVRVFTNKSGWEGVKEFPTMFTVGGNEHDAFQNALTIVRPETIENFVGYAIRVVNADPDSDYHVFARCAERMCFTCGLMEGEEHREESGAHEFNHICTICKD